MAFILPVKGAESPGSEEERAGHRYPVKEGLHTAPGSVEEKKGSRNPVLHLEQAGNHPQGLLKQIAWRLPEHF